ncbi:DHA2 family efflux MFS transporter permease subunit [Arthrobacter zhangbolii]|uniref:DHA2 family efflux MFS transporter permease subunit n=1 Tax=Arthrobacter zhangbolii TaxID=2886936 RepID=A0A9X1M8C1_9MICC|nr:DHA2 family efflux MFS transporter permease subunit [Arthrobacter zhangbolii]MCC3272610.1 DHA2 family efflux MFS transporter permease subunit [Arthrobacter zhangbolii]MCC3293910.1 DHA2 family efflux MFS transporter permease subunit [Arthrobacter zhangbolii]UON91545.1 DHA2 family efflux MFS transporter permease subunit [Arthrobacter zhangbolii]
MGTPEQSRYVRYRWWGLLAISLGVATIIMDATIVSVAIPSVVGDLGISSTQIQWVQEIYTLLFAALLLTWGRIADRVGRRRIMLLGVVIFVGASLMCALAGSGGLLILGRALQGLGGSMILPTTLALLNANFQGRERGIAFAVWGSTIGGMAAVGPLLGGWLIENASWRWAFGINLPVGALVIAGLLLFVAESSESTVGRDQRLDVGGALLSILGFGALVFGLIEGRSYGWWSPTEDAPFTVASLSPVPWVFLIAALSLTAFVLAQRRRTLAGQGVILDLSLFRIRSFANGNLTALIVSFGEFGLILSLPLWFQNVLGYTAFQAGLALLPLAAGSFLASGAVAGLSRRYSPIIVVRIGLSLEVLGIAVLALLIRPDSTAWLTSPLLFVYGLGVGLATAQLTSVILAEVPVERSGQGSATQSTARQTGSALGIAVLGTAFFTTLRDGTRDGTADAVAASPALAPAVDSVDASSGGTISALAENPATAFIADAARDAMTNGASLAGWIAAGALVIGLLTSLRIHPVPAEDEGVGKDDSGHPEAPPAAGGTAAEPGRKP